MLVKANKMTLECYSGKDRDGNSNFINSHGIAIWGTTPFHLKKCFPIQILENTFKNTF